MQFYYYDWKRNASNEHYVREKNFMLQVNKKSFDESHGTKKYLSTSNILSSVAFEDKEDEVICLNGPKESEKTRQDIVNWIYRGYIFLQYGKNMMQIYFEVMWHNHNKSRVGSQ